MEISIANSPSQSQLNGQYQTSRFNLFPQSNHTNNQSNNHSKHTSSINETSSTPLFCTTSHDEESGNSTDHSNEEQSFESPVPVSPVIFNVEQPVEKPILTRPRVPLSQVVASLNRDWSMETLASAESGDVESMCLLGQMYAEGWGAIKQSNEQSKYWLKKAKSAGLAQHVDTIEKHMNQSLSGNQSNNHLNKPSANPSNKLQFWMRDSSTDSSSGSSNDIQNHSTEQSSHHTGEHCALYSPSRASQSAKTAITQSNSQPSFFSTLVNAISPALKVRQAATVRSISQSSGQAPHSAVNPSRTVARSVSTDQLLHPSVRRASAQLTHSSSHQSSSSLHDQDISHSVSQSVSDDDRTTAHRHSHRMTHVGRSSYHNLFVTAS